MDDQLIDARKRYRRAWVTLADFMEAGAALNARHLIRTKRQHELEEACAWLVGYAVVAYIRPFSKNWSHPDATGRITLDEIGVRYSEQQLELHEKIETLRDKVVAHSDFSHKIVVPQGAHAAEAVSLPAIIQLQTLDAAAFTVLIGAAVTGIGEYKARLRQEWGNALDGV